jgi:hypothetical protein
MAWWRRAASWPRARQRASPSPRAAPGVRPGAVWPIGPITARHPKRRPWRQGLASAALLLVVALSAVAVALALPTWQVRRVRVLGTKDATLVAAVRALPLAGCLAPLCDTGRAAALVRRLPWVGAARVWVAADGALVVRVTPRAPVLVWRLAGRPLLVAADGTVLGPAGAADLARLPAVDDAHGAALAPGAARTSGARIAPALVGLAAQVLFRLPATLGPSTALRFDATTGLAATDGQGLTVVFGDPGRPPGAAPGGGTGQLARLRALLAVLAARGERAVWIDLRWGTPVAYRLG